MADAVGRIEWSPDYKTPHLTSALNALHAKRTQVHEPRVITVDAAWLEAVLQELREFRLSSNADSASEVPRA